MCFRLALATIDPEAATLVQKFIRLNVSHFANQSYAGYRPTAAEDGQLTRLSGSAWLLIKHVQVCHDEQAADVRDHCRLPRLCEAPLRCFCSLKRQRATEQRERFS